MSRTIIGHDGKTWPETFDGRAWAQAFAHAHPTVSPEEALGWFCNAIMVGYDNARWQHAAAVAECRRVTVGLPPEQQHVGNLCTAAVGRLPDLRPVGYKWVKE